MRWNLYFTGGYYVAFAIYMIILPFSFFDSTPGVSMMGPFNAHFIRDAAFGMGIGGAAMIWGAYRLDRPLILFGTAWPVLHAAFHIWIWIARGLPFDFIAFVNLTGIQIWAWLALFCALNIEVEKR